MHDKSGNYGLQNIVENLSVFAWHIHLSRVYLVLAVAVFSGLLFGTIGYYMGLFSGIGSIEKQQSTVTLASAGRTTKLPRIPLQSDVPAQVQQAVSPDRSEKATLIEKELGSNDVMTSFVLTGVLSKKQTSIDLPRSGLGGGYMLKSNSWSPNGKYLYVMYSVPDGIDMYLVRSDGTYYANAKPYVSIHQLLIKKVKNIYLNSHISWNS